MGAPYIYDISSLKVNNLTFILLTWKKLWAPNNASKQQMGFNSGFKGLNSTIIFRESLLITRFSQQRASLSFIRWKTEFGKGKGKIHPRTGHESPEGAYRHGCTLSLPSAFSGLEWTAPRPAALPPGKKIDTYCTGDWVGNRVGQDRCGKSRAHRDSIPDRPTSSDAPNESKFDLNYR